MTNPFEEFDLHPEEGPQGITERLRQRIEEAADEEDREAIREAWRSLTMDPRRRVALALGAHPESRPEPGAPPSPREQADRALELRDLVPEPSLAAALGVTPPGRLLSFSDDPILRPAPPSPDTFRARVTTKEKK